MYCCGNMCNNYTAMHSVYVDIKNSKWSMDQALLQT